MNKLSSTFVNDLEGESDAWTFLAKVLGQCDMLDTLADWDLAKTPLSGKNAKYTFKLRDRT